MNQITDFLEKHWSKIIIGILLLYFFAKVSYFSEYFIIRRVPVDEAFHFGFITGLKNPFDIFFTERLAAGWGQISRMGFLFHFSSAILLKLNLFFEDITFLRSLNILITIGYFYFFTKLSSLILKNKLTVIFSILIHVSLLQFTFISGLITYDNLTNFLSIASIYFLVKSYREKSFKNEIILAIFLMLGSITKPSFLPLFLAIIIVYAILNYQKVRKIKLFQVLKHKVLLSVAAFLFIVNSLFYLQNLVQYKRLIIPQCDQIYAYEECWKFYSFKRSERFKKELDKSTLAPIGEYFEFWSDQMIQTTFGLPGFPPMIHGRELHRNILIVLLLTIIGGIFVTRKQKNKILLSLLFIVVFHVLILFYQNYKGYLTHGQMYAGLHGRYAFPILGALIILYSKYTMEILRYKSLQVIGVITIGIFLNYNEFFFYMKNPLKVYMENDVHITNSRVQPFLGASHIGPITKDTQLEQSFTSRFSNLTAISIYFSTFGQKKVDPYQFELYQNSCEGTPIRIIKLSQKIKDNQTHPIYFDKFPQSRKQKFCFLIRPLLESPKNPITVHVGNTDLYRFGHSNINGIISDKDLAFDSIYKKN